jgi:hypothetical protein
LFGGTAGIGLVILLVLSSLGAFSSPTTPKGTVVSSRTTSRYGAVLVVGGSSSGGLYGFPLYEFSGDVRGHFGCVTQKIVAYDQGAKESVVLTCTGPQRDLLEDISSDDWPALTTKSAPIAGRGVNSKLLGTIVRPGIGRQITYAGHPLYLFDPSSQPFMPQGENFMETVKPLPPWHGYWYLVSARDGAPSPGVATLEAETLPMGQRALALEVDDNVDPIKATLYASASATSESHCDAKCQSDWTLVVTNAYPHLGPGVNRARVGITRGANGSFEVTYDHHVLYLYDREEVRLVTNDRLASSGSGNGVRRRGPGGVMAVVSLGK